MPFQTLNPYNNQLLRTFPEDSEDRVAEVLSLAEKAFRSWKATSFVHRGVLMRKVARALREKNRALGQLITMEMGKPLKEAMGEINKCATACDYYADHAEQLLQDEHVATEAGKSLIIYQPLGAVFAIMPWNFPFWQVFRFACPTLMAGNVGILKHAPNVPQCALAIESLFKESGFPDGVFSNLFIAPERAEQVIASKIVHAVTLTGSEGAGSKVAELAGKHIKKTVLELGGSDAFVVLADADLAYTAAMAVKARMINTGQSCICAKRFIVLESIAEDFLSLFRQELQLLKGGDPLDGHSDFGPLARKDLVDKLRDQVQQSVALGAQVWFEGKIPEGTGFFFPPMILTKVKPGMPAYEEELFGPVATVLIAKDEVEAIALANDSRYGLGASVWTRDVLAGERVARQIESGAVFVNEMVKSDPGLPFGGIKKSGYGRELSYPGIREFVNIRTVWVK